MVEFERLNPQQFERFQDFIYRHSGIRIDARKVTLLSNRLRRRLQAGKFADFDAYYQFLVSPAGAAELETFLDAITTNETSFFRTPKHFDWLRNEFLPEMLAANRSAQRSAEMRFWSAGCSTGAEPYSIAICLAENAYRFREWKVTILGTDISEEVLRGAREGRYRPRALELVTPPQRRRYFRFHPELDLWEVNAELRRQVRFACHNLIRPLDEPPFDCVFIRNVLIYFDRESKRLAIHHLVQRLAVGGYLVVGPSEGIYDMLAPLHRITPFLYRKEAA